MGEAKRGRETESTFGMVPKTLHTKGLVISDPIQISKNDLGIGTEIDQLELRFALLYWDKLVWPKLDIWDIPGNADTDYLEAAQILKRPIKSPHGEAKAAFLEMYLQTYIELDAEEPGVWALSQGEKSLFLEHGLGLFSEGSGMSLNLLRAIPIPANDVPLNEILEFKEKRKDELLVLRAHIDKLVQAIQSSPTITDEFNRAAKEVDEACSDMLTLGREWQWPVHFADFKASFNLKGKEIIGSAYKASEMAEVFGMDKATAALIGGLVSAIQIKPGLSFRSLKRPSTPYRYAYLAHKELA